MEQTKGFTASKYHPQQWVDLIKESGVKYAVITINHHDDMTILDTKIGELSTVKNTPTVPYLS